MTWPLGLRGPVKATQSQLPTRDTAQMPSPSPKPAWRAPGNGQTLWLRPRPWGPPCLVFLSDSQLILRQVHGHNFQNTLRIWPPAMDAESDPICPLLRTLVTTRASLLLLTDTRLSTPNFSRCSLCPASLPREPPSVSSSSLFKVSPNITSPDHQQKASAVLCHPFTLGTTPIWHEHLGSWALDTTISTHGTVSRAQGMAWLGPGPSQGWVLQATKTLD